MAGAMVLVGALAGCGLLESGSSTPTSTRPPPPSGWFQTQAPGAWSHLPDDDECARRVHRSVWEPRPDNAGPNGHEPDPEAVHAAFRLRPRAQQGAYDAQWDSWLLARVSGQHTGTTDENIQWAACKWGIADNLLRAIAVRESSWFQYEVYPSGLCVEKRGCGDLVSTPSPGTRDFCAGLAAAGHDYTADFGSGSCPKTFSIVGVMSWHDPRWGAMAGNQNGTFPFNRDSTAFALDYLGSFLRGCQEGWATWLGARGAAYRSGDIWGCVGAWYSGSWWSAEARRYVDLVRTAEKERPWLDPHWDEARPPCAPDLGCPRGTS
jgi:hypothetical protein